MFAAIYQSYLLKGTEEAYKTAWQQVAQYFIEHCGAEGSCLHQTKEGVWLAYSRWPSKQTRDLYWGKESNTANLPAHILASIDVLKNCVDEDRALPDMEMVVVEDLLLGR